MRPHRSPLVALALEYQRAFFVCASFVLSCETAGCAIDVPPVPQQTVTTSAGTDPTSALGSASASENSATPNAWTLLFYGSADADHAAALASDFAALDHATFGPDVNVVVAEGGSSEVAWSLAHGAGAAREELDRVPGNSADRSVLRAAVARAFHAYPSARRAVVVWTRGAELDTTAVGDGLNDAGIRGDRVLELLGLDTSRAPRLESTFALRGVARVLAASSSSDGAPGWAYRAMLDLLGANPGAGGAELVHGEDVAWNAAPHAARRLRVAVDGQRLENLGRAAASFVEAVGANPDALVDVGAAAASAADSPRASCFGELVNAMTRRPNLGVVTAASVNAAEHLAAAAVAGPSDVGDFVVSLPPASAITPEWVAAYDASAAAWNGATGWNDLVGSFARYGTDHTSVTPSFDATIATNGDAAVIHVLSPGRDLARVRATLVGVAIGEPETSYGVIGAASAIVSADTPIAWTRRIATVGGEDATMLLWRRTFALAGRLEVGGVTVPAAVLASSGTSFVIHPDADGEAVSAAALLARDPQASFMPALVRGTAAVPVFGPRIAVGAVVVGSRALGAGAYEVRIEGDGATRAVHISIN